MKDVFAECPESLALDKIRCSHACDSMVSDIKYHSLCWRDIIDKWVPEHEVIEANKTDESVSNDIEANIEEFNEEDTQVTTISLTYDDEIMDLGGRLITKITGNEIITPISSIKEIVISQIVAGCKVELADGKALTMNNLVQIYKKRVVEYGGKDGRADSAIRIDLARVIQRHIYDKMDGVQLQNPYLHKQSQ